MYQKLNFCPKNQEFELKLNLQNIVKKLFRPFRPIFVARKFKIFCQIGSKNFARFLTIFEVKRQRVLEAYICFPLLCCYLPKALMFCSKVWWMKCQSAKCALPHWLLLLLSLRSITWNIACIIHTYLGKNYPPKNSKFSFGNSLKPKQ